MAERDFDAERTERDTHSFTIGGETFHTYTAMSVTFWKAQQKREGDEQIPLERTIRFLRSMILREERERFDAMLESEETYIAANELLEVSNWLIEVISGTPTKSPASSGSGGGRISSGSKVKPSRAAGAGKN